MGDIGDEKIMLNIIMLILKLNNSILPYLHVDENDDHLASTKICPLYVYLSMTCFVICQ